MRSRYLSWVDGRLAQMVIATDITPRRLAEEQTARQTERAQSVSRLITMGEMASSVAHELNQPLTAISNYCSGIISRIHSGQITEEALLTALEKTAHQAQRAGQIIQRIRDFVKKSEPNRQLADVAAMVDEAVELADIELRRHNVRLTHYVAARLPPVHGRHHPDRAGAGQPHEERRRVDRPCRSAHPHGAAWSCAWCPARSNGMAGVEFSVQDTGKGLAPEVLERLFEAFFSTKTRRHGHGPEPVPHHRRVAPGPDAGREHLQWSEVTGCRFSFWLPLAAPATDTTEPVANARYPKDNCMSLIPKKGTVYVVDDDEAVRDSLQWLLEGKDYRVRCFDSAESFLSRYDPREVACLIVDIRMGGMTGLELQDRLLERNSPLPIVFITGHGDVPMAVDTMKKGALDFIQKPFNEEALVSLVERMLDHAREAFAGYQQAASRDALLSKLTSARSTGARAHRGRSPEQADRRRPGHQHQDGGGAPRQHHGKAQRQHGGRPAQNRPGPEPPKA